MQAYYQLQADIPVDHHLNIILPDTIPPGKAIITVSYETGSSENINPKSQISEAKNLTDFLGAGKAYQRFSSVKEIDNFVAENRETWES